MCDDCKEGEERKVLKKMPLKPTWKKLWAEAVRVRDEGMKVAKEILLEGLSAKMDGAKEIPRDLMKKARYGDRLKIEFDLAKNKFYALVEEDLPINLATKNMGVSDDDKSLLIYAD